MAQVRTRKVKTLRNRNGFIKFATRTTPETPSQNGEDGIIEKLFTLIPAPPSGRKRWAVDVGAWNGKHLSNTYALLTKPCGTWKGLLIEANSTRIAECETLYNTSENICVLKAICPVRWVASGGSQYLNKYNGGTLGICIHIKQ